MKRAFEFEFEDQSRSQTISFDYSESLDEKLSVTAEDDVAIIYANRAALLVLAKAFIKLATCHYRDGFHIHLSEDFDADRPEVLRVVLNDTDQIDFSITEQSRPRKGAD